jgi:hypothetical protein
MNTAGGWHFTDSTEVGAIAFKPCGEERNLTRGGSVEVFTIEETAKAQMDFIQAVAKGLPAAGEYDYVKVSAPRATRRLPAIVQASIGQRWAVERVRNAPGSRTSLNTTGAAFDARPIWRLLGDGNPKQSCRGRLSGR